MGRFLLVVYYVVYAAIFAGWLTYESRHPEMFRYSRPYLMFLLPLALPFFVPLVVRLYVRRLGRRGALIGVVPAAVGLGLLGLVFDAKFGPSSTHRFDPFLQQPSPTFDEVPRERTHGHLRVLVLGGSTSTKYPAPLSDALEAAWTGGDVEVLVGAASWYTTKHSLINYVTYCRDWKPDVVVIMHGINDLVRSFAPPDYALPPVDDRYTHYYGPAINGARTPTTLGNLTKLLTRTWYGATRVKEVSFDVSHFRSIVPFRRHLTELVRQVRSDGAVPIVLTQPTLYKPTMTDDERHMLKFPRYSCREVESFWRQSFPDPGSMHAAMAAFNAVVRDAGRDAGAVVVDAAAHMPKDVVHFNDDCHYTDAGRTQMAGLVAAAILTLAPSGAAAK